MDDSPQAGTLKCPFLRPVTTESLGVCPAGVYCRLPGGGVRIPSRDELVRFCTAGHHYDCVTYRRARQRESIVSGLA